MMVGKRDEEWVGARERETDLKENLKIKCAWKTLVHKQGVHLCAWKHTY